MGQDDGGVAAGEEGGAEVAALGRLAAGVAHDFNNLLTVILGCGEGLRDEIAPDDERQRLVEGILDAGDRATELTKQLLSFSRRAAVEPQVLDVNTVVETTLSMLRRLLGEHIVIRLALSSESAMVRADPGQLQQVLLNLVGNAVKFTARGEVTLAARYDEAAHRLIVTVADGSENAPVPSAFTAATWNTHSLLSARPVTTRGVPVSAVVTGAAATHVVVPAGACCTT